MNKEEKKYCENDVKVTKKACKIFKSEKTKRIAKKVGIFTAGAAAGAVGTFVAYKKIKNLEGPNERSISIDVIDYSSARFPDHLVGIGLYKNNFPKIMGEKPFYILGGWTPEHALEIGSSIIETAKGMMPTTGE